MKTPTDALRHEALDRAYTISVMVEELLAGHPGLSTPELRLKLKAVEDAASDLYQAIGGSETKVWTGEVMAMNWQSPTTWSRETKDGALYIEKHSTTWHCYVRGSRCGIASSEKKAKAMCEKHLWLKRGRA